MANVEFREEVDAEIHGRDSLQSKEGLETRWSSVLLLETRGSTGLFGAEFRREFFLSLPSPGAIMNHKASSMETWNSLWKELKTCVIPKDEAGLSVRGSGEELRILGARRPAPVRPPPRLRPASLPLFLPRCPALRSQAPFACLGGSWEPGNPADPEHCISRAEAASRNHDLFLQELA